MFSAQCAINLHEWLEHALQLFRINADSSIPNPYGYAVLMVVLTDNIDAPSGVE